MPDAIDGLMNQDINDIPEDKWEQIIDQAIDRAERFMTFDRCSPGGLIIASMIIQMIVQRGSGYDGADASAFGDRVIKEVRKAQFREKISKVAAHVIDVQKKLRAIN